MDAKRSIKILIAFIILLIIGSLIIVFNGFKLNFNYDNATRIEVAINKQLNVNEINALIRELYPEETIKIEMVGAFEDTIGITMKEVNDAKTEQLIAKLNEKYNTELDISDVKTYVVPASNLYDMIKPYIWTTIIAFGIILVAICITYRKNGILKTLLSMLVLTIGAEILYAMLISIFNIQLTQTILIGSIGIILFVVVYLAKLYEKSCFTK